MQHRFSPQLRFDADRRSLSGVLIPFGTTTVAQDAGTGRMVRERIVSGAFDPLPDTIPLTLMHVDDQTVATAARVTASDNALRLDADLDGPSAAVTIRMLERGTLTGLSADFFDLERNDVLGVSEVRKGLLVSASVVDRPAYPQARNIQMRIGEMVNAGIPLGQPLPCGCVGGDCDKVEYEVGAFTESLNDDSEILIVNGDYKRPLGSQRRGTLRIAERGDRLEASFTLPDNEGGRDLLESTAAVDFVLRPLVDDDQSDFTDVGGVRRYSRASLRALIAVATDADDGWLKLGLGSAAEKVIPNRRMMARRLAWL